MPFLIVTAIFIAIPLALQLRGRGIVGLTCAAACLYGLGILLIVLLLILPAETVANIAGATFGDPDDINGQFHDTYYVVANFHGAIAPTAVFAGLCAVFWFMKRQSCVLPERVLLALFWVLHLAILTAPNLQLLLFGFDPQTDDLGVNALQPLFAAQRVIGLVVLACLLGFVAVAFWSVLKRLRA